MLASSLPKYLPLEGQVSARPGTMAGAAALAVVGVDALTAAVLTNAPTPLPPGLLRSNVRASAVLVTSGRHHQGSSESESEAEEGSEHEGRGFALDALSELRGAKNATGTHCWDGAEGEACWDPKCAVM